MVAAAIKWVTAIRGEDGGLLLFSAPNITDILSRDFTLSRHKDWWYLNSYSSGIGHPDGNGPHQGSFSEAIFSYWAVRMYGEVTGDKELLEWGLVLAATELYSANTWVHLTVASDVYPKSVRGLGTVGRLSEMAALFQATESTGANEVYSSQLLPLTLLSIEVLEPNWITIMAQQWNKHCTTNPRDCVEAGGDISLVLMNLFAQEWDKGANHFATTEAELEEMVNAGFLRVLNLLCFQRGRSECGLHTLTNSVFWAALSHTLGGAFNLVEVADGAARF